MAFGGKGGLMYPMDLFMDLFMQEGRGVVFIRLGGRGGDEAVERGGDLDARGWSGDGRISEDF